MFTKVITSYGQLLIEDSIAYPALHTNPSLGHDLWIFSCHESLSALSAALR